MRGPMKHCRDGIVKNEMKAAEEQRDNKINVKRQKRNRCLSPFIFYLLFFSASPSGSVTSGLGGCGEHLTVP